MTRHGKDTDSKRTERGDSASGVAGEAQEAGPLAEDVPQVQAGEGVRAVEGDPPSGGDDVGLPLRTFVASARRDFPQIRIKTFIDAQLARLEEAYKKADPRWGTSEKCSSCGFCLCRGCHDGGPCATVKVTGVMWTYPLRLNYQWLMMNMFPVQPMPPGAQPIYMKDIPEDDQ